MLIKWNKRKADKESEGRLQGAILYVGEHCDGVGQASKGHGWVNFSQMAMNLMLCWLCYCCPVVYIIIQFQYLGRAVKRGRGRGLLLKQMASDGY